jgi:hypothetical protein
MNSPKKLTSQQQNEQQQQTPSAEETRAEAVEFSTIEAMLRHDALHTPVPPRIAKELSKSIQKEAPAPRSWWRRLLGGGG